MKLSPKSIIQSAMIAAIYSVFTIILGSFGFGPVQFRIAEALTVLPAVMPSSIPGLFIGCILANWLGGFGTADIVFGSMATLLAAVCTRFLRNSRFLYPLPPVLFNAAIVGSYVYYLYDRTYTLVATMVFIGFSELVICYGIGLPLIEFIKKNPALKRILSDQ
ncbi:MAG TPA: QueT transporter family protein [Clostridiaceae bacterium]|nr:QueT transporter family protein [Clostridiaceae bacterium]